MAQHTCVVCGHTFGTSTFPGGSTTHCSRTCGTRWGMALLPKALPAPRPRRPEEPTPQLHTTAPEPALRARTARCGHKVPFHRGRHRRWCDACQPSRTPKRPKLKPEGVCERCNHRFEVKHRDARFCSRRCSSRRYPPICTTQGCSRPHRAKGLCSRCYKDLKYPDRPRYQFPNDPEARRKRDLIRAKKRRAATRGVSTEDVDRQRVGERDGWRCGICRKRIDPTLKYPHPDSQSLDHVVPLTEGGPHSYANTRITHVRCNVLRQHRGGGEQLALLG